MGQARINKKNGKTNNTAKVAQPVPQDKGLSTIKALVDNAPKFIEAQDYKSLARLGAAHGAFYLEDGLKKGESEEEVSFIPEAHIYKDGKCVGIAALAVKSQDDLDKMTAAVFEKTTPNLVLLLVSGQWMSNMALKNGGRPSQQPDRVNVGVGTVYLAPGKIVASAGKPVFSDAEPATK